MSRNRRPTKRGSEMRDQRHNPKSKSDASKVREDKASEGKSSRNGPMNDISWYSRYPSLLSAAGSFPFPYRPGMKLPVGNHTVTGIPDDYQIPGILALSWVPAFGWSEESTDPASVVGKEIYSRVRAAFSGTLRADAPDYVMYLGAMDSVFAYIAWLRRLYRVLNAWTPDNRLLPDALLTAMHLNNLDIEQLRLERVQLWQYINELTLQSRKFKCPAIMDIFNRHFWMSDNVYTDAASINSQMYMFVPDALYKFAMLPLADGSGNTGPGLELSALPVWKLRSTPITAAELYQYGVGLLQALVDWDEALVISGYLERAYQGVPSFTVAETPLFEPFNPVFEPEVLSQIENSRTAPITYNPYQGFSYLLIGTAFRVTQNPLTNAIVYKPSISVTFDQMPVLNTGNGMSPTLSIRNDAPTVADNVIASRLQMTWDVTKAAESNTINFYVGTEIPVRWAYYGVPATLTTYPVNGWDSADIIQTEILIDSVLDTATRSVMDALLLLPSFDWHPLVWVTTTSSAPVGAGTWCAGDVHNTTVITVEQLRNLHM